MPLNVNAKEWHPKQLSQELMNMRINSAPNTKSSTLPQHPVQARPYPHSHTTTTDLAGTSPATSSGDPYDTSIEDELQFEEIFEQRCNSGEHSRHITPRNSLVGPSPLPSPVASPQTHMSLLAVTEGSSYNRLSSQQEHSELDQHNKDPLAFFASTPPYRVLRDEAVVNHTSDAKSITDKDAVSAGAAGALDIVASDHHPGLKNTARTDDHSDTHNMDSTISTRMTPHHMTPMTTASANTDDDTTPSIATNEPTPIVTTHIETAASAAASGDKPRRLGPDDFELLKIVGQGAFGKVFQVRKRDTGEVFAMKVMRKDRILEKRHGEYVKAERDVLTAVVHPYVVTLRYSFQTSQKLYLVLDFINGGHLFFQLYRAGTFDEPQARLYTAELVIALAHLHSLGFVHRDLKPENVLLDNEGHIKVTDFGLAKGNMSDAEEQRSNSFIGTMEYMAPEVVAGRGHGKAVDWWSVGILLYEMLCGMPPFRAKSRQALQKMITGGKLKLPTYLSSDAASLLKGLLQKEAPKRLGFGPQGSSDIMQHSFFKGIDWKKLEKRGVASPFKPTVRSHDSVENFDKIWTNLPPKDSPCATPTKSKSLEDEHGAFDGFTYCAPSFMAAAMASPQQKVGSSGCMNRILE